VGVFEYAMRIADDAIIPQQTVSYWIHGRLSNDGEVYVCYDEAVPQSIVELHLAITSSIPI